MRKDELVQMLQLRFALENGILVSVQPVAVKPVQMQKASKVKKAVSSAPKKRASKAKQSKKQTMNEIPEEEEEVIVQEDYDNPERLQRSNVRYRALRRPIMLIYSAMVREAYDSYFADDFPNMEAGERYSYFMKRPMAFYKSYPDLFRKFGQFCPSSYSAKKQDEAYAELMNFVNADV
jgi:hypothetical protein